VYVYNDPGGAAVINSAQFADLARQAGSSATCTPEVGQSAPLDHDPEARQHRCDVPGEPVHAHPVQPGQGQPPGYRPSNLSGSGPVRSFLFRTVMSSTSVADSSKSKMSMFSRIRSGVTDLGNTMSPRWMCQRSTT
jgi:hypothetical protein